MNTDEFLPLYNAQLAAIPESQAKSDGISWGETVAQAIIDLRASDGWDAQVTYEPSGEIGRWKPTPPMFAAPLLPGWGAVAPFSMTAGSQFRPQAPPPVSSSAYAHEVSIVKAYGAATGSARTDDQTEIALFWNDNPGTLPDQPYTIRASSDLETWETIGTLTSENGVVRFTDSNASAQ